MVLIVTLIGCPKTPKRCLFDFFVDKSEMSLADIRAHIEVQDLTRPLVHLNHHRLKWFSDNVQQTPPALPYVKEHVTPTPPFRCWQVQTEGWQQIKSILQIAVMPHRSRTIGTRSLKRRVTTRTLVMNKPLWIQASSSSRRS